MNKLKKAELITVSSMLFGMFFGAGNLIFPIHMGQLAGGSLVSAVLGFLVTGVGLPLLGVMAIGMSYSNGLYDLACKVTKGYGMFFTCALYLTIGPFFAIPRCATVSYTVGIEPIVQTHSPTAIAIFSFVFFLVVLGFSLYPGKILTWVGKILTPIFLLFLGALVITALTNPIGGTLQAQPVGEYAKAPFIKGFLEGYNTMDALAGLAFGIIVIEVIRGLGIKESGDIASNTVKAGFFSCLMMAVIYAAVAVVGAQSRGVYEVCQNGAEVFAVVANHYFGKVGAIILACTVTFACLKTAVGLVTSCAETFVKLFPKTFSYKVWAIIFSAGSFLVANLGLDAIIEYAVPVLMFLYPLAITLILMGIFGKLFGHNRYVYCFVTAFTFIGSICDLLSALPKGFKAALHLDGISEFLNSVLPLSGLGLGWVLPAVTGFIIGITVWKITRGETPCKGHVP